MNLPYIQSYPPKGEEAVREFQGLDERLQITNKASAAMRNMSSRFYPAIATREARGAAERTISTPNGLLWKNGLFWVDGTACYYKGNQISGLTVTNGKKQLVGMGAYIVIFPDKKVYNTATGEVTDIDVTFTQSGTLTFQELSTDSVFCKISGTGIGSSFRLGDGVTFSGVNDDSFQVDGQDATKTITEIGSGYIVVTASIQHQTTGAVKMEPVTGESKTKLSLSGINSLFSVGDYVRIVGAKDDALNVTDKAVDSTGSGYIIISGAMAAKTLTSTHSITAEPYYTGASQIKITGTDIGSADSKTFHEGDIVSISGANESGMTVINGNKTVRAAGVGYIVIDGTIAASKTQASGITITRTAHQVAATTVKRTKFTRTSGVTIKRQSQNFDFVCEHDNRLWACSSANHEIYASKLGDPTNWQCYEGISTDSYTVSVGSDGDFTGCISHMGQVLFFKERTIHVMYGNRPSNFQLDTRQAPGVREGCADSLTIIDETLFYVGRKGVYAYDGATPTKISNQIVSDLSEAVACQQDDKYYLSCVKDGSRALLVFDPRYQTWMQEDETVFKFASYGDGKLYYIEGAGNLRTITGGEEEVISWFVESGSQDASTLDDKYVSKAKFHLFLDKDAHADFYFQYDDDPLWEKKGTIRSSRKTTYTLPVIPRRCNRFRWRVEGYGGMILLAMSLTLEGGSEINGDIQHWFRR